MCGEGNTSSSYVIAPFADADAICSIGSSGARLFDALRPPVGCGSVHGAVTISGATVPTFMSLSTFCSASATFSNDVAGAAGACACKAADEDCYDA